MHGHEEAGPVGGGRPGAAGAAGTAEPPSFERVLLDLAVGFVNVPLERLDEAIDHTLRTIGQLSGVGRSYLFTYDWDQQTCTNTHEWCAPGVRPVIDDLQQVNVARMQDWVDRHRAGQPVYREDTSDPALEAAERDEWAAQGITALITLPLMSEGACVGFVGFDVVDGPRTWDAQDLELLGVFAQLLAHAEERRTMERVRQSAEELAAANEQLTAFAGAVSHDLKAPLTTVRGMLSLLGDPRIDEQRRVELLERALGATQRMAGLIDRLLAYAAAGREIGDPVPLSFGRVVEVALEHLAVPIQERDLGVDVGTLPVVLGDEVRLVEVVQNLVCNVVGHVPADRRPMVVIRGHRTGDTVVVTVADNGDGIAATDHARVLRSFERGPGLAASGAGLGLPMCARIIAAHGGTFDLSTSSLGGLLVTLQLPAP